MAAPPEPVKGIQLLMVSGRRLVVVEEEPGLGVLKKVGVPYHLQSGPRIDAKA